MGEGATVGTDTDTDTHTHTLTHTHTHTHTSCKGVSCSSPVPTVTREGLMQRERFEGVILFVEPAMQTHTHARARTITNTCTMQKVQ